MVEKIVTVNFFEVASLKHYTRRDTVTKIIRKTLVNKINLILFETIKYILKLCYLKK